MTRTVYAVFTLACAAFIGSIAIAPQVEVQAASGQPIWTRAGDNRLSYKQRHTMVEKADAIAIVRITKLERVSVKINGWTYRQKASATVEKVVKGKLARNVLLYGEEQLPKTDGSHKVCRFGLGRYLVFLDRSGNFLTGNNRELSAHPIAGNTVTWMADDDLFKKKKASLDGVLKGIDHIIKRYTAQRRLLAEQLAKFKSADPAKDLQTAWDKGDLRFIGVYGITLFTPGVERGKDDGFVSLVGVNGIRGTSDYVQSKEQGELNTVAWKYAERYNALLLPRLKASKTTNPVIIELYRQIELELQMLETSDPKADFRSNIQKGDFRFLYSNDTGLAGISDRDFDELRPEDLDSRDLRGSKATTNKEQCDRLRRAIKRYVEPYNKMMFDYLKAKNRTRGRDGRNR